MGLKQNRTKIADSFYADLVVIRHNSILQCYKVVNHAVNPFVVGPIAPTYLLAETSNVPSIRYLVMMPYSAARIVFRKFLENPQYGG